MEGSRRPSPPRDFWTFAIAVSIDSFAYAFAPIVLITYMSSLTTTQMAASQFALLTSICALPGSLVAGVSGYFVHWLRFEHFFIATSLIGAPVGPCACGSGGSRRGRHKTRQTPGRSPPDDFQAQLNFKLAL
jgi:PAT family beta-lactamase induction signal transducer AmpG